jgi:hypothetical protein
MAATQDSLSDIIVKQMTAVYPQLASIEVPGIQTWVAMMLATAGTVGRELTYEQAYADVMRNYANAADANKLIEEQRAKARADAFKTFADSVGPLIESEALNISADNRPNGIRILINYDVDSFDDKNEPIHAADGSIVKLPIQVKIEPTSITRLRATSGGTGSSGRTPGVFKLWGTSDPIQLAVLAKGEGKADSDKTPARDWLTDKGFKIEETADSQNVKWVHRPENTANTHNGTPTQTPGK